METQAFMGTGELIPRLIAQVGDANLGMSLAVKNGFITPQGGVTALGMQRNAMTAEQRATVDRDGRLQNCTIHYTNRVTKLTNIRHGKTNYKDRREGFNV